MLRNLEIQEQKKNDDIYDFYKKELIYFTLGELYYSGIAIKKGINNTPTPEIKNKFITLVVDCFDPILINYNKPIHVLVDTDAKKKKKKKINKEVGRRF